MDGQNLESNELKIQSENDSFRRETAAKILASLVSMNDKNKNNTCGYTREFYKDEFIVRVAIGYTDELIRQLNSKK